MQSVILWMVVAECTFDFDLELKKRTSLATILDKNSYTFNWTPSESPAHKHAQCPIAARTLCWQIIIWRAWKFISHILWEWQLSESSCINNKNSISDIFCILGIFLWIFALSTVQLQIAAWTSMKTSKWKQRTSILWLGWKYMTQTKADCLLRIWMWSSKGNETVSQLLESQWSLCGGSC